MVPSTNPADVALRDAFSNRDPLCTGICVVPDYQLSLYYVDGEASRRIDFSKAGENDINLLYQACKPAPFGRGKETVLDETYRKAGKMDLDTFSTPFDPRNLGIHDQIAKRLLTQKSVNVEMELYKLNVYGQGDFFKSHKDTPRSQDMFGSLVVVLPTQHEGGQLVLRHQGKSWTIDFSDKFAAATEPSVCFIAFFGDIEHEVLPVTSGYRATLTYNLYSKSPLASASYLPTPFYQRLKETLVNVMNNLSALPNGGYLGFGLAHEYVFLQDEPVMTLMDQLKGSDRALADVCDELGLKYFLRFLYRDQTGLNFLTARKIPYTWEVTVEFVNGEGLEALDRMMELGCSLSILNKWEVEGVEIIGDPDTDAIDDIWQVFEDSPSLEEYYKDPITQVLEITKMDSFVKVTTPIAAFGNDAVLDPFYGEACMVVSLGPAEKRVP